MKGFKFKKTLAIIVSIVLVIGISAGTAILIDKKSVPAMTTIKNGLSAYELASENGYTGTMQEWLKSLQGKSAYEIAVDGGYKGTEAEWTTALTKLANSNPVGIKTASFNNNGELVLTLSDDTNVNLGKAVGVDGKDGVNGINGKDGANGQDGKNGSDGKDGIGITDVDINGSGELVLSFSDKKTVNLGKVVGTSGMNGLSAYEIAVITGKTTATSEAEWIESLKGAKGDTGAQGPKGKDGAQGPKGDTGATGATGPQGNPGTPGKDGVGIDNITLSNGVMTITLTNSEKVYKFENIKGADGITPQLIIEDGKWKVSYDNGVTYTELGDAKGDDGITPTITDDGYWKFGDNKTSFKAVAVDGKTPYIKNGTWWIGDEDTEIAVTGQNGENGKDGKTPEIGSNNNWWIDGVDTGKKAVAQDGANGQNGADGDGIVGITVNENNYLVIDMKYGEDIIIEKSIVGADGKDGNGIKSISLTANYELVIVTDNGTTNLGPIRGPQGPQGIQGVAGANGLTPILSLDENGNLSVKYGEDGTLTPLGNIKGPKGDKGEDGVDGKSAYELYKQAHPEYTGTLEEWLASLKGEPGAAGRGILRTQISDSKLIVYYTDNTFEEHDLSGLLNNSEEDYKEYLIFIAQADGSYGVKLNTEYTSTITKVTIPSEYEGESVTTILANGFKNASALIDVKLPDSITTIKNSAFYGCSSLKNINNTLEGVTTLEESAFYNCISLNSKIVFSSTMISIPGSVFYNCDSLTDVTLPNGLKSIAAESFYDCDALQSITIPASVTYIGESAFRGAALNNAIFGDANNWRWYYADPYHSVSYEDLSASIMSDPSQAASQLISQASSSGSYTCYRAFSKKTS